MLNKRDDPIPAKNAIHFTVAFEKFIKYRFPNLCDLEDRGVKSLHSCGTHELVENLDKNTGRTVDVWQKVNTSQRLELNKYDDVLREAELSFRKWLSSENGPAAYVQYPVTGEWRQIDRREWTKGDNFPPGVHEDFVSPDDMSSHGPSDAQFDGTLLKVFFDKTEFDEKLRGSGTTRRGARPKYDWSAEQSRAQELMKYHGDFSPDDPEWNCQARLEEVIKSDFEAQLGPDAAPSESTIRRQVSRWRTEGKLKGR